MLDLSRGRQSVICLGHPFGEAAAGGAPEAAPHAIGPAQTGPQCTSSGQKQTKVERSVWLLCGQVSCCSCRAIVGLLDMAEDAVLVEIVDRVATITLNRPETRNTLNREMRSTLPRVVVGSVTSRQSM